MDPASGHLTSKVSGHPPFGAQVILNAGTSTSRSPRRPRQRLYQGGQLLTLESRIRSGLARVAAFAEAAHFVHSG
jgi:hypothetical protein